MGGPTSVWGCSGDAGELLRRSPLHGGQGQPRWALLWVFAGLMSPLPTSAQAMGGEAAQTKGVQVTPSKAKQRKTSHQRVSPYPKIPVCTGGDTTASSTVSPCSPRARASLCIFPLSGPAPGTGSFQTQGAAPRDPPASPKVLGNRTKRAEKEREGQERGGEEGQVSASCLQPSVASSGTPSSEPDGDNARSRGRGHRAIASPT